VKLGVAELPDGVGWRGLAGAALLGGIGFTMALFVAQLAFAHDAVLLDAAKIGILCGSTLSAALGWAWLVAARTSPEPRDG
jgi:NhaA family Na+:H+ antiporter